VLPVGATGYHDGMDADAKEFHEFWFGPPTGPLGAASRFWEKDAAFDELLRGRFHGLHQAIATGSREAWTKTARSAAVYVVVLDQLSRNMFRGTADAFAHDQRALAATLEGMRSGIDRELDPVERRFFYMPLLHAEDLEMQDRAIIAFATLAADTTEAERAPIFTQVVSAAKHRRIIARFGRFPHRNAPLGRTSTPDELAFLEEPGSAF
jgi:uncharacterized protein (DUF924 family)